MAGLRAAIEAQRDGEVILVTKAEPSDSNSYQAQGGLAAAVGDADCVDSHIADTLSVACGLADEAVVQHVVRSAPAMIRELQEWGVRFDVADGGLQLAREGGHSEARIVHANGDATGRALVDVLVDRTRQCENVKIFDQCFVVDLMTDPPSGGEGLACVGALTYHSRYGLQVIRARCTILAGGGAGALWRETTNPPGATADGIALAFRAGATVADVEMMQFHPTTLYVAGATRSLISEAVRGEGGHLVDRGGNRFMKEYHPMGELAARDVVARAMLDWMVKTGATNVYLDVRHIGSDAFAARFPQIDGQCRSFGIDPGKDLIPVRPAAHYMVGGVRVDLDGHTSIDGLLACGEAACTGLHGANRLASNSLTEALVFGKRCGQVAAESLGGSADRLAHGRTDWTNPRSDRTELDLTDIRNSLRSVLWRNVGIVRRAERLAETLEIVCFWGRYVLDKEFFDPAGWEVQNMLTTAYVLTACAAHRTETRGVHYREDFPETDPAWQYHQLVRRTEGELVVTKSVT